jgi:ABC-type branched-subunit amino acid transport system substrate-binding protein
MNRWLVTALAAGVVMGAGAAQAQETIKFGLLVPQEGVFTDPGNDVIRLFKMALDEHNNEVAGKKIEWVIGPSDATPDTAVRQARKLVEQDNVDIIIGPLSGSEGIAMRDYAKTVPGKTIINGTSAAQETTWVDPAPNFFRFNTDGAQWGYGLGSYVVNEKGWTRVATIAADYSFGYTNFLGFALDFCQAGGEIVDRHWTPLGNSDFASVIAALPDDVDAIYLGLGGTDALNFLNQYEQAGGDANLIGGSILADQSVLSAKGQAKQMLIGTPMSGSQADDWQDEKWQAFVQRYRDAYPEGERYSSPSLYATNYYNATNAALIALEEVGGDLSDGQEKFRAALAKVELDAPNGKIKLDENRQAIGSTFITEVVEGDDGNLVNTFVSKADNVNQTLGMTPEEFRAIGLPGRDTPECNAD